MKTKIILLLCILTLVLNGCSSSMTQDNVGDAIPEAEDYVGRAGITQEDIQTPTSDKSTFDGVGMTYTIDGETYVHETAPLMPQTPVADFMTITAPDSIGVQLRMLPYEVGSYKAGEGPSQWRLVDVWFGHNGKRYIADGSRGSATITLTEVVSAPNYEGQVKGTFSGTFVSEDGDSITVTNGKFVSEVAQ